MKHVAGMMAVLTVLGAMTAYSQETPAPVPTVELTGTVIVMKDEAGLIKSAALKTGSENKTKMITINLDKNGKALVQAAGENAVKVNGVVTEKNGLSSISVIKFEVVKKAVEPEVEIEEVEPKE